MCAIDWASVSNIVTAVATAALACLTALTLIYLRIYTKDTTRLAQDTNKLAQIAQEQLRQSQAPFIILTAEPNIEKTGVFWCLRNIGAGPAYNIAIFSNPIADGQSPTPIGHTKPVGAGQRTHIGLRSPSSEISKAMNYFGIEVTYDGVNGGRYKSYIDQDERVTFNELNFFQNPTS